MSSHDNPRKARKEDKESGKETGCDLDWVKFYEFFVEILVNCVDSDYHDISYALAMSRRLAPLRFAS